MEPFDQAAAILTALSFPVAVVGPGSRLRNANPAALELFGRDGIGQHFVVTFRQPALVAAIERALQHGDADDIDINVLADGHPARWRAMVRPVELADGHGALISFEDLSIAETTSQIRRDFVANVSHELRTPLTAFMGFVETLKGAARHDPEAQDRFLSIMEREAGRMARLIDDLLSLSRVEQDERLRPTGSVDLVETVRRAITLFESRPDQASITFEAPAAAWVQGDERQLEQVVVNLVENAVKYGAAARPVRVSITGPVRETGVSDAAWRMSVADSGEGIAAHHIPRLTERFYRVDTHRSREMGGTGLGLAIVKHIVTRHRGRLKITSEPGNGSQFNVLLPSFDVMPEAVSAPLTGPLS